MRRSPTATATFGSSRRERHDASGFYDRFVAPVISDDATLSRPRELDVIYTADARDMSVVPANSVALVVTSPPYFAGKEYEASLGEHGVPATYFDYLGMLGDVFAECVRVLEPGGRIAVNVANLGRRPYRSLAGDVTSLLERLGLLLRGEIVWWKGRAAGGSCAWGSFQRPANPVLRDVTERIVIAAKGRFDRAVPPRQRQARGLPWIATVSRDEFLEATTDLWEIPPESATRVGHPAPFPVELPMRAIELYTYAGDVVLDPFMGSGTTAVAARCTGRHYLGFETDEAYVRAAEARVAKEARRVPVPAAGDDPVRRAVQEGRQAREVAGVLLRGCGFTELRPDVSLPKLGVEVAYTGRDRRGRPWAFDVAGGLTTTRAGLCRSDGLWRAIGKAAVLHGAGDPVPPLVVLTTGLPAPGSAGAAALAAVTGPGRPLHAVVELLSPAGRDRLGALAAGSSP